MRKMNSFVAILFVLAAVSAEKMCTPGSVVKVDCNTCHCSVDGKFAACTDIGCLPTENTNTEANHLANIETKKIDESWIQVKDYCNTCACTIDKTICECTKLACDENMWNKDGSLKLVPKSFERVARSVDAQVCEPNVSYKDYCNSCICSSDGLSSACTMMKCDKNLFNQDGTTKFVGVHQRKLRAADNSVCTPNSHFREYCNSCICSADGLSKACTLMLCNTDFFNRDGSLKIQNI